MSAMGSISLSGLLGGTAGQIDTTSLINNLMQAQSVPQNQLRDQLTLVQGRLNEYQVLNTKLTALQKAAEALQDPTTWGATAATSSSTSVVASADGTGSPGSVTFSVTSLARAQITSFAVDQSGNVVDTNTVDSITITDGSGTDHSISLSSGAADDVASAINGAKLGVQATVVTTDQGKILQLSATKTGTANGFTVAGFSSPQTTVVGASDAQVTVGNPNSGGYTLTSSSNSFTNLAPGLTVTVGGLVNNVTVSVDTDPKAISSKVKSLVDAANAAQNELAATTGKGGVLEGRYEVRSIQNAISATVAQGLANNGSLKTYGVDIDKTGQLSFDADAFASAFAANPTATRDAIATTFGARLQTVADGATAGGTGTITQSITAENSTSDRLNQQIDNWTTRLDRIKSDLQAKYAAMETALSRLQSQQTYLTSMLKSASGSSSSSGS